MKWMRCSCLERALRQEAPDCLGRDLALEGGGRRGGGAANRGAHKALGGEIQLTVPGTPIRTPAANRKIYVMLPSCFSRVRHFATLWTIASKAPLFMGILQARVLKRIAISFTRASFQLQESNPSLLHGRQILYH